MISFQLFWGCDTSQMAINGPSDFLDISGLIVKSFQRTGDALFPSAMAHEHSEPFISGGSPSTIEDGPSITGVIELYTLDNHNHSVKIASKNLYGGMKTFKFRVHKSKVYKHTLFFEYTQVGHVDRRTKFRPVSGTENAIYTVLNAESTFAADIITQEVADNVGYKTLTNIVTTYNRTPYMGVIKAVGGFDGYIKTFNNKELAAQAATVIYRNREAGIVTTQYDLRPLLAAVKFADQLGAKLNCVDNSHVLVVNSTKLKINGVLYFDTRDEATKESSKESTEVGRFSNEEEGNKILSSVLSKYLVYAKKSNKNIIGMFRLLDRDNKIETLCKISLNPP